MQLWGLYHQQTSGSVGVKKKCEVQHFLYVGQQDFSLKGFCNSVFANHIGESFPAKAAIMELEHLCCRICCAGFNLAVPNKMVFGNVTQARVCRY